MPVHRGEKNRRAERLASVESRSRFLSKDCGRSSKPNLAKENGRIKKRSNRLAASRFHPLGIWNDPTLVMTA